MAQLPPTPEARVLVCGGRGYQDYEHLRRVLNALRRIGECQFCHGAARGADSLCQRYCDEARIYCFQFPADWDYHGKSAGMIRNKQMLDEFKPQLVIAFPGGRGTAGMVKLAEKAGIKVIKVEEGIPNALA